MKFYVQLNEDNVVTDIIEYPYEDYVEVELETPLPDGACGAMYELKRTENGDMLERVVWPEEEEVTE